VDAKERWRIGVWLLAGMLLLPGCETTAALMQSGASFAADAGVLTRGQAEAVGKFGESFKELTPEQEYYIGRAVGATLVSSYRPWNRERAESYLNLLGQTLAQASDLPQTFGGYHFLILDSDEVNAFAAPGGLIFVTRGILRCCSSEETLAAVLAHEIGHVQLKHGLQSIKKGRLTTALTLLATESAKAYGAKELAELTAAFEGSVRDTVTTMVNNGYSRSFEYAADAAALKILRQAGYAPVALVEVLEKMKSEVKPGGSGFGKTHPAPTDRIAELRSQLDAVPSPPASQVRQARFERAIAGA